MIDTLQLDPNSTPRLTPEERAKKRETETTALYASLGEFVAKFELTVFSIRQLLMFVVTSHGAPQSLVTPAYAELTASPLRAAMLSTCAKAIDMREDYDDREREIANQILCAICARFGKLTEARNDIVHGTWFIGWASEDQTDFTQASGFKPKNTKNGVRHTDISRTVGDFDALIDECHDLYDLINRMMVLIHGFTFSKNFIWDGKHVSLAEENRTFKRRPKDL